MRKTRILIVSQYFYPEQFRINDISKDLVNRGYDVTVITGIPNYPNGAYFDGYSLFKRRRDTWGGVRIIRLPIISRGNSSVRLAANYLSFVVSGFFWHRFTKVSADVVFIYEVSPFIQALVGVWFSKYKSIPNIHYVTDLWPENVVAVGAIQSEFVLKLLNKVVNYIYNRNTYILTSSKSFIRAIENRGVACDKMEFWPQYAEDFYIPRMRSTDTIASKFIPTEEGVINIAFTGNLGVAQGLGVLPQVAVILRDRGIRARFYLIGDGRGKEVLQQMILAQTVNEFFFFIPPQQAKDIPYFLAQCDLGLVILSDNPVFGMTIPSKVQSYLACGTPILASGEGEVLAIIRNSGAGFCASTGNALELATQIETFSKLGEDEVKDLRTRAFLYYRMNYRKEDLMNRLVNIINRIRTVCN